MKLVKILAAAATILTVPLVAIAQEDDGILVDEYIISQEFVEAEVVEIKPIARTITVRGKNRGQTRQFNVPQGTRISVNGRQARLRDIRKGDSVMVAMTPKAAEVVVAQLRVPRSDRTLEQRRANPIVAADARPAMLPKTASNQPAILLFGMFALLAAAGLRFARQ